MEELNYHYTLTWTSSNTNVATVSSSGKVTAKSAGTTNITVKIDNGKTATCNVTISAKSVTSVSIPFILFLEIGDTYTLTPTIIPSVVVTSYTWSSDNSSVATATDVDLTILPNEGYEINWLWVDYEDVIDMLVNNVLTLHDVRKATIQKVISNHLLMSFNKNGHHRN